MKRLKFKSAVLALVMMLSVPVMYMNVVSADEIEETEEVEETEVCEECEPSETEEPETTDDVVDVDIVEITESEVAFVMDEETPDVEEEICETEETECEEELVTAEEPTEVFEEADAADGWRRSGGKWYYYQDGTKVTGWKRIDKKYYYFDSNGVMQTGWLSQTSTNGVVYWFYLTSSGEAVSGWQKIGGKWYYFEGIIPQLSYGRWNKIDDAYYYFDDNGVMQSNRWIKLPDSSGNMHWYYLSSSGKRVTGWLKSGGKWYYLDPYATTGYAHLPDNGYYYFNEDGSMFTGWLDTGGFWNYYGSDGRRVAGWKNIEGKWYYFKTTGRMVTGRQTIDDKTYFFDDNGVMQTGWISDGSNQWYYANPDGSLVSYSWKKINGKWYYFYGFIMVNFDLTIDGVLYHFDSNGVCLNPDGN